MSRRRWVYTEGGKPLPEPVEVTGEPPVVAAQTQVMVDRWMEGTRAPDGTDIGARWKRREYMQRNGLAEADDYRGVWAKADQERQAYRSGQAPPSRELKDDVGRVAYELKTRRGR